MQVLVTHSNQYKIGAVGNAESCESIDFLMELGANYHASAYGLFDLLERISKDGLRDIPTKLSHRVDENENIYELIKGDLRLFYFKSDENFLSFIALLVLLRVELVKAGKTGFGFGLTRLGI